MQILSHDIRFALRLLRARVGFTLAAVLSLSLGIGACTAIFSIVDGVLLRALPYPQPERIVHIREINDRGVRIGVAEPNYLDVRERSRTLAAVAQFAGGAVVVTGGNEPARANVFWVSGDFFRVLGAQPVAGRAFLPEESQHGGAPVALVSYGFWQRVLGGKADFSGMKLNVDGPAFTVVGVMPQGFSYPNDAEIWVPREVDEPHTSRTAHNWSVLARVRPDITLAQAHAEISSIGKQLRQEHGRAIDAVDLAVVPLKAFMTDNVRSGLLLILAAVGLLLLVACANVANLLLAQATLRSAELSVRAALGATRWRLARQFIAENLLLAVLASALGIVLSFWGVDLLLSLNDGLLPRAEEIAVNWRALLFTLCLAIAIAVVLGFVPVARFADADLQVSLKEAGRGQASGVSGSQLRNLLVVAQIALTLVLLVGAGLLGRSFLKLMQTDPGFQPESAVAMTLSLPTTVDKKQEQQLQQFHQQLLEQLRQLPGVTAVGGINALPLAGWGANGTFLKDNNPATTGQADYRVASGGYFAAMGIPLLRGRLFESTDTGNAPDTCVISQSLAKTYWPNEDSLGRTLQFRNMDGDKDVLHIVGIVGDVRDDGLDQAGGPTVYAHSLQRPQWWQVVSQSYVVRAHTDVATLIPALRSTVQALNRDALLRFQTMDEVVATSLDSRRFSLVISGVFAIVALLLAGTGVYGVMSYAVSQRTPEIGVRVALGARTSDVLRLVIGQGMRLAGIGVLVGLLAALVLTRMLGTLLGSMLHQVGPGDPLTFAGIALLLLLVALLACYVPARRAARVDPLVALRYG